MSAQPEIKLSTDRRLCACKLQSVRKLTVGHRLVAKALYADTDTLDQLRVTGQHHSVMSSEELTAVLY